MKRWYIYLLALMGSLTCGIQAELYKMIIQSKNITSIKVTTHDVSKVRRFYMHIQDNQIIIFYDPAVHTVEIK